MPAGTASSWQYSVWVVNVGRNSRITPPTAPQEAAIRTYVKLIWNPITQTGTRPWLNIRYNQNAVLDVVGDDYQFNVDLEPIAQVIKVLNFIGRNLKQIPITNQEAAWSDTLFAATGTRRLGAAPAYGSVGGSIVTIP